jgi:hypothetical protein
VLDSTRLSPGVLADCVVELAMLPQDTAWPDRRILAVEILDTLSRRGIEVGRARRKACAELALGQAFSLHREGVGGSLVEPLLTALVNEPAYARNIGVQSMLVTLVLGTTLKRKLVGLLRRSACHM